MTQPAVLIITHDLVGDRMAGPAIRCWEIARQLAGHLPVTLTSKLPVGRSHPDFAVLSFEEDQSKLVAQAARADVLMTQGLMLTQFPRLQGLGKHLVVDLYDPFVFESYPHFEHYGPQRDEVFLRYVDITNEQLALGDYFVCANERQRDLWLGNLAALGRLCPELHEDDDSMKRLIDLLPFGIPDEPLQAHEPVMRGVVPGLGPDDFILLWGGGIWNWFDPLTVIRAVAEIGRFRDDIKLYFMGTRHPNPQIPEMAMTNRAIALAGELGVENRLVFFNRDWVSYADRQAYLAEASCGISAHFDSLETRFAFRTRVLDYFWAGLPVLTTVGDDMAEVVSRERLGATIGFEDVEGWKQAILDLADDRERQSAIRENVRRVAERFRWSRVVAPLLSYCREPYRTPRLFGQLHLRHEYNYLVSRGFGPPAAQASNGLRRAAHLVRKGLRVLKNEGSATLLRKSLAYLRQRNG